MTPDCKAIRERVDNATADPWHQNEFVPRYICQNRNNGEYIGKVDKEHDADFIANARTDIPDLLDYIKRLEAVAVAVKLDAKAVGECFGKFDETDECCTCVCVLENSCVAAKTAVAAAKEYTEAENILDVLADLDGDPHD
jgi:hypothetical protein